MHQSHLWQLHSRPNADLVGRYSGPHSDMRSLPSRDAEMLPAFSRQGQLMQTCLMTITPQCAAWHGFKRVVMTTAGPFRGASTFLPS